MRSKIVTQTARVQAKLVSKSAAVTNAKEKSFEEHMTELTESLVDVIASMSSFLVDYPFAEFKSESLVDVIASVGDLLLVGKVALGRSVLPVDVPEGLVRVDLSQLLLSVTALQKDLKALPAEKNAQVWFMVEQSKLIERFLQATVAPVPAAASAQLVPGAVAALEALRSRLTGEKLPAEVGQTTAEVSEATKHEWISSGLLVGSKELASAWGNRSRQSLDQASDRGELFSLKVAGKLWYPAVFMHLSADSVKAICLALKDVDPVSKVIFWSRGHGALGGKTLAQAIEEGQLERAVQVAEAFAGEYTGHAALA